MVALRSDSWETGSYEVRESDSSEERSRFKTWAMRLAAFSVWTASSEMSLLSVLSCLCKRFAGVLVGESGQDVGGWRPFIVDLPFEDGWSRCKVVGSCGR